MSGVDRGLLRRLMYATCVYACVSRGICEKVLRALCVPFATKGAVPAVGAFIFLCWLGLVSPLCSPPLEEYEILRLVVVSSCSAIGAQSFLLR